MKLKKELFYKKSARRWVILSAHIDRNLLKKNWIKKVVLVIIIREAA